MLTTRQLVRTFGSLRAVDNVDLEVGENTITGLIGPNGAGKTTLFHLIAGTLAPSRGEIRFGGERISGLAPDRIFRKGIARTFQVPRPFPQMTVLENLMLVPLEQAGERFWNNWWRAAAVEREERAARERAMEVLELCALADKAGELAGRLSGGQQHAGAGSVTVALLASGVVSSFRKPDWIRFGVQPLALSHEDLWVAVARLRKVLETAMWRDPKFDKVSV